MSTAAKLIGLTGLLMGLDYATGGTMMVGGRKIVLIEKDDQGKPDVGKAALAAAANPKLDPEWPVSVEIPGWTTYTMDQIIACKGPNE